MITITHATGELRRRAAAFIADSHYMGSDGGSGYLFAVLDGGAILGTCLIGPASSMAAERAIVEAPWRVWQIKRLVCLDSCPLPESKLLWHAMRAVTKLRGETLVFVAYADPAARGPHSGLPLTGRVYLASNFFYAGETSQPRFAVIDEQGRARSSRQGARTLTRRSLPPGWTMQRIPPARVWVTICTPQERLNVNGTLQPTTQRWRKREWRAAWAALNPQRQIAARQWVSHTAWRRLLRGGKIPIGEPKPQHIRAHERFQPAYWIGSQMTRTAAPLWVPYAWQQELLVRNRSATSASPDDVTCHARPTVRRISCAASIDRESC